MPKKSLTIVMVLFLIIITAIMAYVAFWPAEKKIGRKFQVFPQEAADCFDYYQFQKVNVSISPTNLESAELIPGQKVNFATTITSEVDAAIANGEVLYRLVQLQTDEAKRYREGDHIFDEGVLAENVSLGAKASKTLQVSYTLPRALPAGEYRLNLYFTQGGVNWSGLYFTDDVVANFFPFRINSDITSVPLFDRSATTINGEAHPHIGFITNPLEPGTRAIIQNTLLNSTSQEIEGEIVSTLYYWSQQEQRHVLEEKKEDVALGSGESKLLEYDISQVTHPVYVLVHKFNNKNGGSTTIFTRIGVEMPSGRVNSLGLSNFPIKADERKTFYVCYHSPSNRTFEGTVTAVLKDKEGKILTDLSYSGKITPEITAIKRDFLANYSLDDLVLTSQITDETGSIVDNFEATYTCQNFGEKKCVEEK